MGVRIDARYIYPLVSRKFGVSVQKVSVALLEAGIVDREGKLAVNELISGGQMAVAGKILGRSAFEMQKMFALWENPLVEPGVIFDPRSQNTMAGSNEQVYEPLPPARVPYKIYGEWVFHFIDGRSQTVFGGEKLTEEQMRLVRDYLKTGVRRRYSGPDEFEIDREGLSIEFAEQKKPRSPNVILKAVTGFTEELSKVPGFSLSRVLLIGSFGWGCFVDSDDVDLVLIGSLPKEVSLGQLKCFWEWPQHPLALKMFSVDEWQKAQELQRQFLLDPVHDFDENGFNSFSSILKTTSNNIVNLAWMHNYLEIMSPEK
jgi:hypothetical protein